MGITRGDQVPHFEVTTLDGRRFSYASIWQLKNIALLTLSEEQAERGVADLFARVVEFDALTSICLVTRDHIAGCRRPAC